MVVDDDKQTREFVANVLMYCVNREVLTFANGCSAWKYLDDKGRIDIVLSDIDMPEMDGLALLENIKVAYPDKICILMSGNSSHKASALNRGASAFLPKPFKVNDLFKIVQTYVVGEN